MHDKEAIRLGKTLSWILRHGIVECQLDVDSAGYVSLPEVMRVKRMQKYTVEDVKYVVDTNEKQRFSITTKEDGLFIRANQGHSAGIEVDSADLLTKLEEPIECIHATYMKYLPAIKEEGLKPMHRKHVHLAPVGEVKRMTRKDSNVHIKIDMAAAMQDGIEFYMSANGVVLTEATLDAKYFAEIIRK